MPTRDKCNAAVKYLAAHNLGFAGVRCGAIEVNDESITVCVGFSARTTKGQTIGFRVEHIANNVASVRAFLGY
jgi:hypothetical protein